MDSFFAFIADDRYGWWWLFVGVPFLVLSWAWTAYVRKGQLDRWSLASSVVAPSMLSHVLIVTVVLGIAPLLAFSVLNWLSQYMTWPQFGVNFGCWLVGAAGGIAGGVLGARSRAERELVQYPSTALRRQ